MRLTEKIVQFIVGGGQITNVDEMNNEDVLLNIDIEDIQLVGTMSFETRLVLLFPDERDRLFVSIKSLSYVNHRHDAKVFQQV